MTEVQFFAQLVRAGFTVIQTLPVEAMAWAHGAEVELDGASAYVLLGAGENAKWQASLDDGPLDRELEIADQPTAEALAGAIRSTVCTPPAEAPLRRFSATYTVKLVVDVGAAVDAGTALKLAEVYAPILQADLEDAADGVPGCTMVYVEVSDPDVTEYVEAMVFDDEPPSDDGFDDDVDVDGLGEE